MAWLTMVFTTYLFVFYFLPLVLVFYYALDGLSRQAGASDGRTCLVLNTLLVLASYIFYGWWNPWFIFLMLGITVVNYVCGRIIGLPGISRRLSFWVVTCAIVVSLGTLGFFKYFLFFEANLNQVLAWFGAGTVRVLAITLPIGISFYTFHALSYTIDVYRGTAPPVRSFIDFACYIALFPQLVAGPIIRYNTVADQLVSRSHTWEKFASGVTLFILGFAKKILLANPMGRVADAAFDAQSLSTPDAWFGALAYAFQIYFDFSGYSDMAIGLGRMIGFEFLKNFDSPYKAESITDFWRRWHISLSTFLRDYLYIPLGGNRKGPRRTYVNLILVMLLGGLWHGANWTFVAWGAYHGILLAFERFRGKRSAYRTMAAAGPRGGHVRPGADLMGPVSLGESARGHELPGGHDRAGEIRLRDAALAGLALYAGDAPDHGHRGRGRRLADPGARVEQGGHLAQGNPRASAVLRLAAGDVLAVVQPVPLLPVLGSLPCGWTVVRTSSWPLSSSP